jgi:hypothetical protein
MKKETTDRRKFIEIIGLSVFTGSLILPDKINARSIGNIDDSLNHIGPKQGYTSQIGTLISMLDWISNSVVQTTKNMTVDQLDYLHDKDSNTIGSLIMHVVATEVIYQDITFHGLNDFSKGNKEKWSVAMELGEDARQKIKGNKLEYYVDAMKAVREITKAEMKKRNDKWLLSGETKEWGMNNYCKWFHVTEHFANHRGQITWYSKRIPK